MDVSSESAEPSWADSRRARLLASYLPIALAAAGCVAAVAIVLMGQDLTSQRSAWEHDKPVREQLREESATIDQKLADRRQELADLDGRLRDLRQNASAVQSSLDKAQADKNKTHAERVATQTRLDSLH
jgi:septal ring factor EnvC (AmiA/AmiB activator)